MASVATSGLPVEERRSQLDKVLVSYTNSGWRVLSRSDTQAQLVKGKPTSHLLHFFLSLFTLGLWIPVWICVSIFSGESQKLVMVDEQGFVHQ